MRLIPAVVRVRNAYGVTRCITTGVVAAVAIAGCGTARLSSARCDSTPGAVTARAGKFDFALELHATGETSSEMVGTSANALAPVRLRGMAGTSVGHIDVRVCRSGTAARVTGRPAVAVVDRTSGNRAVLRLVELHHKGDPQAKTHYGANLYLPHHAAVVVSLGGATATLVPPTD